MQFATLLGCGAVLAVALVSHHALRTDGPPLPAPANAAPQPPDGHYALVVEGDASRLAITHAVLKTDPWAGIPTDLTSEFQLEIRDRDGAELASVPLDLSRFDTDPAHIGQPLVVSGCEVRDTRVALLINVPRYGEAAEYRFVRGGRVLGTAAAAAVQAMAGDAR